MTRSLISNLLEILGFLAITLGVASFSVGAGGIVGGVCLVLMGYATAADGEVKP